MSNSIRAIKTEELVTLLGKIAYERQYSKLATYTTAYNKHFYEKLAFIISFII